MKLLYLFQSKIGPFYIGKQDNRFHPIFEDDSLGSYEHAWQAADDLAAGHTHSIRSGVDTSTLEIPSDLGEWEALS